MFPPLSIQARYVSAKRKGPGSAKSYTSRACLPLGAATLVPRNFAFPRESEHHRGTNVVRDSAGLIGFESRVHIIELNNEPNLVVNIASFDSRRSVGSRYLASSEDVTR